MAANSENTGVRSFQLFQSADESRNKPNNGGLGFLNFPETPLPPCVEVLPSEVSASVKYTVEKVDLGVVTLLKGRVSTQEVFALPNSDLVPGKYEGGLKLWEGSLDLVKTLHSEIQKGDLSFEGKRVLELGCGHGLPGIFASLKGAGSIHFQDFNLEVLKCLTLPNVNANLPSGTSIADNCEIRYFAGDWREVDRILPHAHPDSINATSSDDNPNTGYDMILMAETVYSISTLQSLYNLIKKCVSHPHGVIYFSAKKHYFGVGGGSRQFVSIVEKDGMMLASLIAEVADGSSNLREVWKLSCK
ncbi:histidine protein methyltransferase 1 homolog [Chenopodium quinoa]|uniref:protein-histidine N-methyltransferase n=1 Tax=Chenopodium quinoa TaxID=63459 RepID=A0A803LTK2_CHEQI|nr:histidine protein methyltransferase 1 homolog [Chenopodium quinoa]